jgi:hypothetical protein
MVLSARMSDHHGKVDVWSNRLDFFDWRPPSTVPNHKYRLLYGRGAVRPFERTKGRAGSS